MIRPELIKIPLEDALKAITLPGSVTITLSIDQWDMILQSSYDSGFTLLELDENEKPINAYRKIM